MIFIDYGNSNDIDSWMRLVRKVSSSFPGLETEDALAEHRQTVLEFMSRQEAICAKEDGIIVGVLLFSRDNNIRKCCLWPIRRCFTDGFPKQGTTLTNDPCLTSIEG